MTRNSNHQIHYCITPSDPYAHLFSVELQISFPIEDGQLLRMPSWIPGSYMIRDFAKNIVSIHGQCGGKEITLRKVDKQTWRLPSCASPITIRYDVYAWDMSVRSAHLDQNHAYFNGTSVFLEVVGHGDKPCTVDIHNANIPEAEQWLVGTSMSTAGADLYGFGRYQASDYSDLIDHPVEMAAFDKISFDAGGVQHDFILTGLHNADLPRLAEDLTSICNYQINLFGAPAPFQRYVFITWAVGNGYGGLEHRASTSLICNRDDLPATNERGIVSDGYKTFLGLCSHEYFHSWNVKRIKPNIPYDLSVENHTPLLWAFEGITSYFDDLTLVRTGLITTSEYLELLGKNITRVLRNPGRFNQSTAESSFDTWTKFYKQDENAANAIVSYYSKGALIALSLDLTLRQRSNHQLNLDQIMQKLWQEYGITNTPVQEFDIQAICTSLLSSYTDSTAAENVDTFLQKAIYGTEDLEFEALFKTVGVHYCTRPATSIADSGGKASDAKTATKSCRVDLGITFSADSTGAKIQRVINGSCAHQAGISAGDILIALNNIKVDSSNLEKLVARYNVGEQITLHGFRRDELMQFSVTLKAAQVDTAYLEIEDASKLQAWLS